MSDFNSGDDIYLDSFSLLDEEDKPFTYVDNAKYHSAVKSILSGVFVSLTYDATTYSNLQIKGGTVSKSSNSSFTFNVTLSNMPLSTAKFSAEYE